MRYGIYFLIVLLFLAVVSPGLAEERQQLTGGQYSTYSDPIFKYSITYPKSFHFTNDPQFIGRVTKKIKESANKNLSKALDENLGLQFFIFRYPIGSDVDFNPNLNMVTQKIPREAGVITAEQFANVNMDALPALLNNMKIEQRQTKQVISGKTFYRISYTHEATIDGKKVSAKVLQLFYVDTRSRIAYVLTFTDTLSSYSRNLPAMEEVIKTIKFAN